MKTNEISYVKREDTIGVKWDREEYKRSQARDVEAS